MCVWRLVLLLHCGSETKAVTAVIYLHIISMLCSDTDTDETHAHVLPFFSPPTHLIQERYSE